MRPATSCSCCHDFPTMMDNTHELWAKTNLSLLRLLFQVFSHDNDEKIAIDLLLMLTTSVSYIFSLNFYLHNRIVLFLSDLFVHPSLFLSCCCGCEVCTALAIVASCYRSSSHPEHFQGFILMVTLQWGLSLLHFFISMNWLQSLCWEKVMCECWGLGWSKAFAEALIYGWICSAFSLCNICWLCPIVW